MTRIATITVSFLFGVAVMLAVQTLNSNTVSLHCLPGSRGNVCLIARPAIVSAREVTGTLPAPIAQCGDGTLSDDATLNGACGSHGGILVVLNDPAETGTPCLLRLMGTVVSAHGPLCLNAAP